MSRGVNSLRYIAQTNDHCEILSRLEYLYDVTKLYFVVRSDNKENMIADSFPFGILPDICVIYGHTDFVIKHLCRINSANSIITGKNVFVITCNMNIITQIVTEGKRIFTDKARGCFTHLLKGEDYGFDFDITETELNIYNAPCKDVLSKFLLAYGGK